MIRRRSSFTLLELLTVIGIIIILAGILIPTVIISRERGKITQAKADISDLVTALKNMDGKYEKMLAVSGSAYKIGGKTVSVSSDIATLTGDAYNAMIAELSAPKNSGLTTTISVNKRKITFLEPKKGFDPEKKYTEQPENLWRDPWGNPYKIFIKVTKDDELEISSNLTVPANVAVYSFGPNGTDDGGCHVDRDSCISSGSHKNHDDIASWDL